MLAGESLHFEYMLYKKSLQEQLQVSTSIAFVKLVKRTFSF